MSPVFDLPPDDQLPIIRNHQVTRQELDLVMNTTAPYFVGLGPVDKDMTPAQQRREARRRARQVLPDVKQDLTPPESVDGKPVAGFILATFFLMYVLPSLVGWVIDKILEWALEKAWSDVTTAVPPKMCSLPPDESSDS